MINKQFPSSYDIEQTICFRNTQYDDAKRFYQSLGLLNIGSGKEHLASLATNLLLEHQDYNELRRIAQGANAATNISGFSIRTKLIPKTISDIADDLSKLRSKLISQEEMLKKKGVPLQRLQMPQLLPDSIKTKFEYQRTILGRVELIQKVDTEVEFKVEPVGHQEWRVVCFPQANQDIRKNRIVI
jgi:hypothetical protein